MKMIYPCKSEKKLIIGTANNNNLNLQQNSSAVVDVPQNTKRSVSSELKTQTLKLRRNKQKKINDLQRLLAKNFLTIRKTGKTMELVPTNTPQHLNSPKLANRQIQLTTDTNDSDSNLSSLSLNDFHLPTTSISTSSEDDSSSTLSDEESSNNNGDEKTIKRELNLIIHRLPGEKLGMALKVEENSTVMVNSVLKDSAADRASDIFGYSIPIRVNDVILEINGVSLKNLKKDEISLILNEIPLYVSLKICRQEKEKSSPTPTNTLSKQARDNLKIPLGFGLHTIYLSSLESKCVMPNDLKETQNEFEGYYRICRNTLQIGGEEDYLQKGDVLVQINGDELAFKNKFEIISKLSGLSGIAEVTILRKTNKSNFMSSGDEMVPYHNGIFAQNSIKLAMRKYEKPANSDGELKVLSGERQSIEVSEAAKQLQQHDTSTSLCLNCQKKEKSQENWMLLDPLNNNDNTSKVTLTTLNESKTTSNEDRNSFTNPPDANASLTCSSCHSDRSQVQLNLVCCEPIDENPQSPANSTPNKGLKFISTSSTTNEEIVDNNNEKSYISIYKVDLYYPLVEYKQNAETLKIEKRQRKSIAIGKQTPSPPPPATQVSIAPVEQIEIKELIQELLNAVEAKEEDEKKFEAQQEEIYEELANLQSTAIDDGQVHEFKPDTTTTPLKDSSKFYSLNLTKKGQVIDLKNTMHDELIGLVHDKSKSLTLGKGKLGNMIERIKRLNSEMDSVDEPDLQEPSLTEQPLALIRSKSLLDTSSIEPTSLQEQLKFELSRYSSTIELLKEQTLRKAQSHFLRPTSVTQATSVFAFSSDGLDKQSKLDSGIGDTSSVAQDSNTSGCVVQSSVKEKVLLFQKNRKNSFNFKKKPKSIVIDQKQNKSLTKNVIKTSDIPEVVVVTKHKEEDQKQQSIQESSKANFRSVKEKIAYFSAQTSQKSTPTVAQPVVQPNSQLKSTKFMSKKESTSIDDILQKNAITYDSLQTAYKNSLINTLKSMSKSNPLLEKISPSNTAQTKLANKTHAKNDTKSEIKSVLYSNENKISNLIKRFANT